MKNYKEERARAILRIIKISILHEFICNYIKISERQLINYRKGRAIKSIIVDKIIEFYLLLKRKKSALEIIKNSRIKIIAKDMDVSSQSLYNYINGRKIKDKISKKIIDFYNKIGDKKNGNNNTKTSE